MVRGFLSFCGIPLVAGAALLTGLQLTGKLDLTGLLSRVPEVDAVFQRGFRSDAMADINRMRSPLGVEEVRGDEELQACLQEWVDSLPDPAGIELDSVFDALQTRFPGAQYLAANLVTSRDRGELLGKLVNWDASASPEFDSVNTAVFRSGNSLGALGVMSRRIPAFSLDEANVKGGRFHNRCPHCGTVHALELGRELRTLILSCPHCDLPFDVLAVGSDHRMHRATDFFEGFSIPGSPRPETGSAEEQVLALWRRVSERCQYEAEQDRHSATSGDAPRDVWKTSSETWEEARGDCEDTSILLADILITAGFDARVAIGWNGNVGQHAWVVVRVGGRQYLLETTLQKKIGPEDLVEVSSVAGFYQPEQVFDRQSIYFTTARPEQFTADYFAETVWKSVPGTVPAQLSAR